MALELLADYTSYTVIVRQLGPNVTGVNNKGLLFGNTALLKHSDILELLENIVAGVQRKISSIIERLGVPIQAFVSTGKESTETCLRHANGGVDIDMDESLYVGDAAGRPAEGSRKKKDFSFSDRLFALNIGIQFFTPEEHFLGCQTQKFNMPEFDPRACDDSLPLFDPPSTRVPKHKLEVIILVGYPGSGKSFLSLTHFAGLGYVQANRDTVGNWQKCVAIMEKSLQFREFSGTDHSKVSDMIYNMYKSKYAEPSLSEGFDDIVKVNFVPKFRTSDEEKLYRMFLLEK
ncbi:Polynucleotide kinase 3 phosphatase and FHA domain-containing protein [Homarus americanus]|uniref:Polynucleotide kinase 3 phosphatase and FHA domain-containing protein n=1 Tax=Homarus americanus TaxID=6706 RepID=A0A8J5JFJ3_HOMAM|nr:Polynucleotide kinase 3 phosphatase and FHA domain-containing protein [Homarus americanus]